MKRKSLAAFFVTAMTPALVAAQDTVQLSDTQVSYNQEGVALTSAGKYDDAIRKFESSLTIGAANITYLNLGRALQKNGDCKLAKDAYGKVASAPGVQAPSRGEVEAVANRYAGELPAQCPVRLKVVCDDPLTSVTIDGGAAQPCGSGIALETTPGEHVVSATLSEASFDKQITGAEGDTVEVAVAFPTAVAEPTPTEAKPVDPGIGAITAPRPRGGGLTRVGIPLAIGGSAILATALLVDWTFVRAKVAPCALNPPPGFEGVPCDSPAAEEAQLLGKAIWTLGWVVTGTGVALVVVGKLKDRRVSATWNGGPGIAYTQRF